MLFTTISDLKTYVGGGANLSVELDSIAPIMHMAAIRHLIPYLGQATYDWLIAEYAEATPAAEATALLPYVQRPLALLSLYEYAAVAGVQLSEAGILRVETENMKTAYKYQETQYRDYMLHNGYEALEEMIKFLLANRADYALWDGSTAFRRCFATLVYYASDLRDLYAKYLSRYTFEIIRPCLTDVEQFVLVPMLGDSQYTRLLEGIQEDDLTDDELALLQICQRATAFFAVKEASARHWVRIEGYNVVQSERNADQALEKTMPASSEAMALRLRHDEIAGNRYITQLRSFLDAQEEGTFPAYDAHVAALAAAAEEEAAAAAEASGETEYPELYAQRSLYYPPTTDPKGIIRF